MKPLLVGEDNPQSHDPRHALYPYPPGCSGERLCRLVMGLSHHEYLRSFDRVNLCAKKWGTREARENAGKLVQVRLSPIVMLGAKVRDAFGAGRLPFFEREGRLVALPHPSGRNRAWNEPGAFERARQLLRDAGVLL